MTGADFKHRLNATVSDLVHLGMISRKYQIAFIIRLTVIKCVPGLRCQWWFRTSMASTTQLEVSFMKPGPWYMDIGLMIEKKKFPTCTSI